MAGQEWKNIDFSGIKGMNYTPSYAANDVMTWRDFDADTVDRELALAERLGLNSVRTWLQYLVFENDPGKFRKDFDTYLSLCEKHGLRAMPILFDSCFGDEPTIDWDGHWVMSPGTSREVPEFWPELQKYVDAVVGGHIDDDRVLIWDIMNEPAFSDLTVNFVKHWCAVVREMDRSHPLTVGVAGGFTQAQPFAEDQDVLSMHSYANNAPLMRYLIRDMQKLGAMHGKPVIITECCAPAWGCAYEMAFEVLRETGIGYYAWEVVIGKNQFNAVSGLLYPDGSCRRASEVAAVMGCSVADVPFPQKPDAEGIPVKYPDPEKTVIDAEHVAAVEAAAESPTTPDNFEERRQFIWSHAMPLGSVVRLTLDELKEAFDALHKVGRAQEAEVTGENMAAVDTLIGIVARHTAEIDLSQFE